MAEIPYRYAPDSKIENLVEKHAGLEAGQETSDVVTVAGRSHAETSARKTCVWHS